MCKIFVSVIIDAYICLTNFDKVIKTIRIMTKKIELPVQKERTRFDRLNELQVEGSIEVELDEQYEYSRVASTFHRITDKRFRTSRKGQPEGKARVWRTK